MLIKKKRTHRIHRTVAHLAKNHPDMDVGGVSAFARNLELVFDEVLMLTPDRLDWTRIRKERIPIICDNQWVCCVPEDIPAIGFQHGVAAVKYRSTRSLSDLRLSLRQKRAAKRERTLWVACAQWISDEFARRHKNPAAKIIYHQVDLDLFDGRLDNRGSRLILHDARSAHKGRRPITWLKAAFPNWRFELIDCAPERVPDRMRRAAAFVHLSLYEGNSIVCNEAMAHNLPCLFTRVGLMKDATGPTDVTLVDPVASFSNRTYLIDAARPFFSGLQFAASNPRDWVFRHASLQANISAWRKAIRLFDEIPWG